MTERGSGTIRPRWKLASLRFARAIVAVFNADFPLTLLPN